MKKKKKILIICLFGLFSFGCQQKTKLDNLRIGMSLSEIQGLTKLEKVAENQDTTMYRCWVDGGLNAMRKYGSVFAGSEPYLLTFDNDLKLTRVLFDNSESTRKVIRAR